MSNTALKVSSVGSSFGSTVIHRDVSFEVEKGTIVAIIGGSGAGKSVLLRECIGLLRPTSGSIQLLGIDVWKAGSSELSLLRKRIGVLFQNGALFSALTVAENVEVPMVEQLDLPQSMRGELISLRLKQSGLDPVHGCKLPSELSGGMKKRAALARALALEPEVLFLDEPTSGLDPINARAFDTLVRTLADNIGLTIILVTHDLDTIHGIADKIIVLGEGTVLASGSVAEIVKNKNPWIQEYFAARTVNASG